MCFKPMVNKVHPFHPGFDHGMTEIPIYKVNYFRHADVCGGVPREGCVINSTMIRMYRGNVRRFSPLQRLEHSKMFVPTSVSGFKRTSGFRLSVTLGFLHEAPGLFHLLPLVDRRNCERHSWAALSGRWLAHLRLAL